MKIRLFVYLLTMKIYFMPAFATQEIDNSFYTAKIPGKPLCLVMEQVTPQNLHLWKKYISIQTSPRVASCGSIIMGQERGTGIALSDGSGHSKAVLDNISFQNNNETWIAYVTRATTLQRIPSAVRHYEASDIHLRRSPSFVQDLEMFVTITSSPNALITTHQGIARSVEGLLYQTNTKNISIDLHSFAAKVMLKRNPLRKYMVNAPVFAMEKIMVDALPDSVFVGTREMQSIMKSRVETVLDENFRKDFSKKIESGLNDRFDWYIRRNETLLNRARDDSIDGKKLSNQQIINRFECYGKTDDSILIPVEINGSLKIIMSPEKEKSIQKEIEEDLFVRYKNPFFFTPEKDVNKRTPGFLKFMETNPPILSVDCESWIKSEFTIYDHEEPLKPWLTVQKGNQDYNWLFQDIFTPAGLTHHIVVDLKKLAAAREVEKIEGI